jgi:L-lactate utilization protein LutC
MIKGVDAQVMTTRAAEYSKDVSAMLRKDELANAFADRMSKLNAQQQATTVSQLDKAEQAKVRTDQQERGAKEQPKPRKNKAKAAQESGGEADMLALSGVSEEPQSQLLDIEV